MEEISYPRVLYKYLDAKGGLAMIETEQLWLTRAINLNDPYDCYHTVPFKADYQGLSVELDYNEIFQDVGVCSLTDNPLNFLMWSYYNGHAGICVGIDMEMVISKLVGYHETVQRYVPLKKVHYQNEPPKIDPYVIMPKNYLEVQNDDAHLEQAQNAIDGFLSTKASWWEHEHEYRLILREGKYFPEDLHEPAKVRLVNLINSVYVGCKYAGDIKPILQIAKKRKFNVYRLELKKDVFGLKPEELYVHP